MQHNATHCNLCALSLHDWCTFSEATLQHTATHCNTLQHTATHCSITLQHAATHYHVCASGMRYWYLFNSTATHCSTTLRQRTATHCNTLQYTLQRVCLRHACLVHILSSHTATHCNTLQHTATHCNTLQSSYFHVSSCILYRWRRRTGCLIFIGHFPQKSPIIIGFLRKMTYNLRHPISLCYHVAN